MSVLRQARLLRTSPPELVVHDEPSTCYYLPAKTARLPLRLPIRPLTRGEFEARLASGDRRQGRLLYRTECAGCSACEPIRIDAAHFALRRTQRRILRRGDREITTELGALSVDEERLGLYNLHKQGRNLTLGEPSARIDAYRAFLGESCCDTFEMRYRVGGELIGVAIVDRAEASLSAVYLYFDPAYARLSPGVYSILKQVELCRSLGLRYLYLGFYIAACRPMSYKNRFVPHERLLGGQWQRFERAP